MAWNWSHSAEAYANVRKNVENLSRKKKEVIFAEWRAAQDNVLSGSEEFNQQKYDTAERYAESLTEDVLTKFIIEKMESQAVCDNGGHLAWACPYGCGPHTVPFDIE